MDRQPRYEHALIPHRKTLGTPSSSAGYRVNDITASETIQLTGGTSGLEPPQSLERSARNETGQFLSMDAPKATNSWAWHGKLTVGVRQGWSRIGSQADPGGESWRWSAGAGGGS
ncbi:hypothetical protein CRG98_016233 [Punica granatum]|uniref:Uncharacterized protein n=1 Tax=Punica granatum TaxID=22663 RepID=A0A2I0K471_PUNGR|nr:hypothetical protein CRG98_016233 [Punica granatum]